MPSNTAVGLQSIPSGTWSGCLHVTETSSLLEGSSHHPALPGQTTPEWRWLGWHSSGSKMQLCGNSDAHKKASRWWRIECRINWEAAATREALSLLHKLDMMRLPFPHTSVPGGSGTPPSMVLMKKALKSCHQSSKGLVVPFGYLVQKVSSQFFLS